MQMESEMTQSQIFCDFMRATWDDAIRDVDGNSKYDEYSDANVTAAAFGAKAGEYIAESQYDDNSPVREWLFPDGSVCWVICNADGMGCGITTREDSALP